MTGSRPQADIGKLRCSSMHLAWAHIHGGGNENDVQHGDPSVVERDGTTHLESNEYESAHGEDDPEARFAAQHAVVGGGGLLKRERFDHGPHAS